MDVETISRTIDRAPWQVAEILCRLMLKGLVQPDEGTIEEAIADLQVRYPRPAWV